MCIKFVNPDSLLHIPEFNQTVVISDSEYIFAGRKRTDFIDLPGVSIRIVSLFSDGFHIKALPSSERPAR
jgi:hypothetical protein